jgi:hypothetical protein
MSSGFWDYLKKAALYIVAPLAIASSFSPSSYADETKQKKPVPGETRREADSDEPGIEWKVDGRKAEYEPKEKTKNAPSGRPAKNVNYNKQPPSQPSKKAKPSSRPSIYDPAPVGPDPVKIVHPEKGSENTQYNRKTKGNSRKSRWQKPPVTAKQPSKKPASLEEIVEADTAPAENRPQASKPKTTANSKKPVTVKLTLVDIMKAAMLYNEVPEYSNEDKWYRKGEKLVKRDALVSNLSVYLALCHYESGGFKIDEVSSVSAAGLCQLMPTTARHAANYLSKLSPDFDKEISIFNPTYSKTKNRKTGEVTERKLLYKGIDGRYSLNVFRWHRAHTLRFLKQQKKELYDVEQEFYRTKKKDEAQFRRKRAVLAAKKKWDDARALYAEFREKREAAWKEFIEQKKKLEPGYYRRIFAADARFDPYVNAVLAIAHIEEIRTKYFDRYNCFTAKGQKWCKKFDGINARMFSTTGYHMGTEGMKEGIARAKPNYFQQYISKAAALGESFKKNRMYLLNFLKLQEKYDRLIRNNEMTEENVAKEFHWFVAQNLFRTYEVNVPRYVLERMKQWDDYSSAKYNTAKKNGKKR